MRTVGKGECTDIREQQENTDTNTLTLCCENGGEGMRHCPLEVGHEGEERTQ